MAKVLGIRSNSCAPFFDGRAEPHALKLADTVRREEYASPDLAEGGRLLVNRDRNVVCDQRVCCEQAADPTSNDDYVKLRLCHLRLLAFPMIRSCRRLMSLEKLLTTVRQSDPDKDVTKLIGQPRVRVVGSRRSGNFCGGWSQMFCQPRVHYFPRYASESLLLIVDPKKGAYRGAGKVNTFCKNARSGRQRRLSTCLAAVLIVGPRSVPTDGLDGCIRTGGRVTSETGKEYGIYQAH